MNQFQRWFAGFPAIVDGLCYLFLGRSFSLLLTYIEWCHRRNNKKNFS